MLNEEEIKNELKKILELKDVYNLKTGDDHKDDLSAPNEISVETCLNVVRMLNCMKIEIKPDDLNFCVDGGISIYINKENTCHIDCYNDGNFCFGGWDDEHKLVVHNMRFHPDA